MALPLQPAGPGSSTKTDHKSLWYIPALKADNGNEEAWMDKIGAIARQHGCQHLLFHFNNRLVDESRRDRMRGPAMVKEESEDKKLVPATKQEQEYAWKQAQADQGKPEDADPWKSLTPMEKRFLEQQQEYLDADGNTESTALAKLRWAFWNALMSATPHHKNVTKLVQTGNCAKLLEGVCKGQ